MAKIVDFKNNLRQQLKYLSTGHALIRLKYDSLSRLHTLPLSHSLVNGYGNSHMHRVRGRTTANPIEVCNLPSAIAMPFIA